ncbi:hypothetical protein Pcinc_042156 [Petrolisthes cinctipes]|uniref:Uncharacterized protein n=1 Tax=Petrolisthes cinctipes TaxID=88211 RepID=A0AAE1BJB6_PETCI|nr:hypothetical protein Pcinc_042156 [Petrolisthes cinctipes]
MFKKLLEGFRFGELGTVGHRLLPNITRVGCYCGMLLLHCYYYSQNSQETSQDPTQSRPTTHTQLRTRKRTKTNE